MERGVWWVEGEVFWVYSHKSDSTEPGSRLAMHSRTCENVVNLKFDTRGTKRRSVKEIKKRECRALTLNVRSTTAADCLYWFVYLNVLFSY